MVCQRLVGIVALVALRAGVAIAAPVVESQARASEGAPAAQSTYEQSACANAKSPTDNAAYEVAQLRAITAHLRSARGLVSGQEVLVRDDVASSMLKTSVTTGRVTQRSLKTSAAGQLQICVEMVFGDQPGAAATSRP
jgi:hypothetical protein